MSNIEKWRDFLTAGTVSPAQQEAANAIAHVLSIAEDDPDLWEHSIKDEIKNIVDELASSMEDLFPAQPPAGTELLELGLDVTKENGVMVPVRMSVRYPKGEGMWALRALDNLEGYTHGLIPELVRRGDESTVTALAQFKAEEEREEIADTLTKPKGRPITDSPQA